MAVIGGPELVGRVKDITVGRTFEALLVFSDGITFNVTTPYSTFIQYEVPTTSGGYQRLEFSYEDSDISLYANGASTLTKYITWVHDGNPRAIKFDTLLIVERIFAQPLPEYNIVAFQPLGVTYELTDVGDRARFAYRVNLKDK